MYIKQIISETEYTPYYFSASSHTEIDFLIQKEGTGDSFGSKGGGKCKGQKPESLF